MNPSSEYLKSLEERLTCDNNHFTNLCEVRTFLKTHTEPSNIPDMSVTLINAMLSTASRARDKRIQEIGTTFDANTWETALKYCNEGIKRLDDNEKKPESQTNPYLRASLNMHAGNCALNYAKETNNLGRKISALKTAIDSYTNAVDLFEKTQQHKIAAYVLGYRGDAHKHLSEILYSTERINNLVEAANDLVASAQRLEKQDPEHASRCYSFASSYEYAAASLARKTPSRQKQLLQSAIKHAESAQKTKSIPNQRYHAFLDYDIGKYADRLHEITRNPEHSKTAIEHYRKAADYFMQNPGPKEDLKNNALQRIKALGSA